MKNFIARCLIEGATSISVRDLSSMVVPPLPYRSWEPGCLLCIPENVEVMLMHFGCCEQGPMLPFVVVKVIFPDGYACWDKMFLHTLTRSIRPDGFDHFVSAHGTATDYVRSFATWGEALSGLSGRAIKVTDFESYTMKSPDGNYRSTKIYGFDLVGEYKLAA